LARRLMALTTVVLLALVMLVGCARQAPPAAKQEAPYRQIMLASTIGPIDAGIVGALEDAFQKKTGIVVRHVGAGTGATLNLAKKGNFDVVLVHAKALEEKFVAEGFGTKRYDVMYNDFVLVGPAADPAKVKGEKSVSAALKKIAASQALFITRGDKSGTHMKELELWTAAGIKPQGAWYKVFAQGAQGNAPTLKYVDEQQGYAIMDRATHIVLKKQLKLAVLVEKDESMLNYITLIPVNPAKFPTVKHDDAMKFVAWVTGEEGQRIIRDFGKDKYGEPLFFVNSPAGKNLK
jgi:tungstate transport system substrate-binding protein